MAINGEVATRALVVLSLVAVLPAAAQTPARGLAPLSALRAEDATNGSPAQATMRLLELLDTTDRTPQARMATVWRLASWVNTGRPMTDLDGPVWQGRGATVSLTAGATACGKRWRAALRPVVFATQNLSYTPPVPREVTGNAFRHPIWGSVIDEPFRFGARSYSRVDPGESFVEVTPLRWLSGGLTTSAERWGPAHYYPLTMGAESGGIPRLFVELRARTWIGGAKLRYQAGRAEPSGYDDLPVGSRSRLVPMLTGSVTPRFFPGLELGGGRLFHVRWRPGIGSYELMLPFAGLLKESNPTQETFGSDWNQLATVFFKVAPPHTAAELYGEFYREDHNVDLRDLVGEPDHASAYLLGVRRAWRHSDAVRSVTLEVANARPTHLQHVRSEGALHVHGPVNEGHTYRGQPLGSSVVLGGGGTILALESVADARTWYLHSEVRRTLQRRDTGLTGAAGGVYALSVGRSLAGRRGITTTGLSMLSGFGLDRGLSIQLEASFAGFGL
jgi:hypothetical protein